MATRQIAETDLYPPLRDYLAALGYIVRGEVQHCDVAASKDDELIIIELKCSLTLTLLAQAAERQRCCESVYIGIPRPPDVARWERKQRDVLHLLKRLELGLILINPGSARKAVEVRFHPIPAERRIRKKARRAVLAEMAARSRDLNTGGSTRRKLVTAYRERALHIACALAVLGPSAPRVLRALGTGTKTLSILSRNVYGWFTRLDRGIYGLTAAGHAALEQFTELVTELSADVQAKLAEHKEPS